MTLRTCATFITMILGLSATAQTAKETPKKDKAPLAPISITLGEDDAPAQKSPPTAAPRTAPAAGTSVAPKSNASAQMQAEVKELFATKMDRLNPAVARWKSAAAKIHTAGGITPDFSSERDLNARISLYQLAQEETENVMQTVDQNFSRIETDLRAAGVPEPHIKTGAAVMLKDVETIMKRMKATEAMCRTALDALNLLKAQWGNWKYANGALDFDIDFTIEDKVRYNQLIQKYKQESAALQQLGGLQ